MFVDMFISTQFKSNRFYNNIVTIHGNFWVTTLSQVFVYQILNFSLSKDVIGYVASLVYLIPGTYCRVFTYIDSCHIPVSFLKQA